MTNSNMNSIKGEVGGVEVEVPIHYIKLKKWSILITNTYLGIKLLYAI